MSIESLNKKLSDLGDMASGANIIEIFEAAAFESWEGTEALIDSYLDLTDQTGGIPSMKVLGIDLYLTIKAYWSSELKVNQLAKLDKFLSNIN